MILRPGLENCIPSRGLTLSPFLRTFDSNRGALRSVEDNVVEHLREMPKGAQTRCEMVIRESLKGVRNDNNTQYTTYCIEQTILPTHITLQYNN
jgi:hypothetical protein